MSRPHILIISGLSGSGKTTAIQALEDAGFFCVDNLPLSLMPKLIELAEAESGGALSRLALGIDARERGQLSAFASHVRSLIAEGTDIKTIFLTADEEVLIRRYNETRRRHPFSETSVRDGIEREAAIVRPVRDAADVILDTTRLNIHELRREVLAAAGEKVAEQPLSITVMSFGFKHGVPPEADMIFDARFLPNPYYQPALRDLTGLDRSVRDFVFNGPDATPFVTHVLDFLGFVLPKYRTTGKNYLTIAIGCTGGQHRSVALAQTTAERLTQTGFRATARHRDAHFNRPGDSRPGLAGPPGSRDGGGWTAKPGAAARDIDEGEGDA
jgi:RNase adapter protein RapZ